MQKHRGAIARPSDDNVAMYIIAIGWLYVTVLMALTETSIVAGVLTLLFYGLFPVSLLVWLLGTPVRRQRQRYKAAQETEQASIDAKASTGLSSDHPHPVESPDREHAANAPSASQTSICKSEAENNPAEVAHKAAHEVAHNTLATK